MVTLQIECQVLRKTIQETVLSIIKSGEAYTGFFKKKKQPLCHTIDLRSTKLWQTDVFISKMSL